MEIWIHAMTMQAKLAEEVPCNSLLSSIWWCILSRMRPLFHESVKSKSPINWQTLYKLERCSGGFETPLSVMLPLKIWGKTGRFYAHFNTAIQQVA